MSSSHAFIPEDGLAVDLPSETQTLIFVLLWEKESNRVELGAPEKDGFVLSSLIQSP